MEHYKVESDSCDNLNQHLEDLEVAKIQSIDCQEDKKKKKKKKKKTQKTPGDQKRKKKKSKKKIENGLRNNNNNTTPTQDLKEPKSRFFFIKIKNS